MIEMTSGGPTSRSMYPLSVFTVEMLPVLATTRPSSGVPTKRVRSDPGRPLRGRPAEKTGQRG